MARTVWMIRAERSLLSILWTASSLGGKLDPWLSIILIMCITHSSIPTGCKGLLERDDRRPCIN